LVLTPNLHYQVANDTVTLNVAAQVNDVMTFTHFRNLAPVSTGIGIGKSIAMAMIFGG
jgi:hypothetical protein